MMSRRAQEPASPLRTIEPYHDDEENDADISGPDAPLRRASPTDSFDNESSFASKTWYQAASARLPLKTKRAWKATVKWVKGPVPPRPYSIRPILPRLQQAPLDLVNKLAPKAFHKTWLLIAVCAAWLLCFSLVLKASNAAADVPGYGSPVRLSCTSRFWNDGDGCGLNGDKCRPFQNSTMAFRCPADCSKAQVLQPHAVGDQEVVYKSLTVGGPSGAQTGFEGVIENNAVYRGDSFICAAAIHSGFISDSQGGCGVTTLTGQQPAFVASEAHHIHSIGFDSYFPLSFGFRSGTLTDCKDLRWPALIVSVLFSVTLSLFTSNAAVFYWTTFVNLFFTVALATDPPYAVTFYGLLSTAAGRFLPAAFCGGVMYIYFVKRSLHGLTAQVEKTILWLGAAWAGALNNYTFDRIPIQRLTPHDIQAQPGAIPALIIIILLIITIALGQAWAFRIEGRMPQYLLLYGIMASGLLLLLALPGENLRIHHYILGLLFIPGTSFQNRPSLIYQGLLVGIFINGIARWGFDSIIQTPHALFGGVQQDSLLPAISVLAIGLQNITFSLGPLPVYDVQKDLTYQGISVLVNDVERFRGFGDDRDYWDSDGFGYENGNYTWTWRRYSSQHNDSMLPTMTFTEYFRFAYLSGRDAMDYTKAGKWDDQGQWHKMMSGPSRRLRRTEAIDLVQAHE